MSLPSIHGGLILAAPAAAAARGPIRPCPLPPLLLLALAEPDGRPLQACVRPGQHVRRGEALARAGDALGTVLPAPTSGLILACEPRALPHPDGLEAPTLLLQPDARDEAVTLPPLRDWRSLDALTLRRRLAEAGVVGLGGGGFATAAKLARPLRTLILNGAECEPYVACDDALLRERADAVVAGAALLGHIAAAGEVVIALEDRMTAALAAVEAALAAAPAGPRLQRVPTVYPQGGERQLIEVVCGREVPSGAWPVDIGIAVLNVATAAAAWQAVDAGTALTTRIVTLAGRGVASPGNYEVRIGTPVADLVAAGGGYTAAAARLVLGGPLMGVALPHDAIGLSRTANAVLVLGTTDLRRTAPERACIRCGDCATACPVRLQPQELLQALQRGDAAGTAALGLADCIECGCCAYVCPSQIPLVDWYRRAKSEQAVARADRARADQARTRYLARNRRLAREQAEKVARVAARREQAAQEQAATAGAVPETAAATVAADTAAPARMDKSAVLAAIARGKARRAQARPAEPPQETS